MASSNVNKIPQFMTIIGYLLGIALPSYRERVFTKTNGVVELVHDQPITMFTMGVLGYIAAILLVVGMGIQVYLLSNKKSQKQLNWATILTGIIAIILTDMPRTDVINAAYGEKRAFANSAPVSWGILFVWIGIFGVYLSFKLKHFENANEFTEAVKQYSKYRTRKFLGPEITQYAVIYLLSLLAMIVTYGVYAGFGKMLYGPAYYQQAVLTYGLNRTVQLSPMWDYFAFITAPFIVTIIGLLLYVLVAGGFAPNGPSVEQTQLESYFTKGNGIDFEIWGYFSKNIPFANNYLGSYKNNVFYLVVVIAPLILGAIIGSFINYYYRDKQMSRLGTHMKNITIMILIVAFIYSMLSAPVYISFYGILYSMFGNRRENNFIKYKWLDFGAADNGNYHPMSIFTMGYLVFLPVMLYLTTVGQTLKFILVGGYLKEKESIQIKGKYIDESITELPFGKEDFIEKTT